MEKVRSNNGSAIAFDRFGDEPPVILVCGGSTAWQTHHWPRPWHCTSPSSTTAVGVTVAGDNAVWTVHRLGKMRDKVKEVSVRKGIVSEFVTLDGAVENPGGAEGFEHGWVGTPTARLRPHAAH
jgi:hypothetical protein